MYDLPLLTLVIWLPIIGGIAVLASGDGASDISKRIALGFALLTFLISLGLWTGFDIGTAQMQFVEHAPWIPTFDVYYSLGVDGLSMPLIILTTFITIFVIIAGWDVITYKPSHYMAAFLIMEGLMVGVFSSWTPCFSMSSGRRC
jgi:NADH-quinone oxidoreductase subunit M